MALGRVCAVETPNICHPNNNLGAVGIFNNNVLSFLVLIFFFNKPHLVRHLAHVCSKHKKLSSQPLLVMKAYREAAVGHIKILLSPAAYSVLCKTNELTHCKPQLISSSYTPAGLFNLEKKVFGSTN